MINLTGYVDPVMLSYTVSIHSKAVKAIIEEILDKRTTPVIFMTPV